MKKLQSFPFCWDFCWHSVALFGVSNPQETNQLNSPRVVCFWKKFGPNHTFKLSDPLPQILFDFHALTQLLEVVFLVKLPHFPTRHLPFQTRPKTRLYNSQPKKTYQQKTLVFFSGFSTPGRQYQRVHQGFRDPIPRFHPSPDGCDVGSQTIRMLDTRRPAAWILGFKEW